MRQFLVMMSILTLLGCSRESKFIDNRVLRDVDDCAFIAQNGGVGSIVFLSYVKELSGPECKFDE